MKMRLLLCLCFLFPSLLPAADLVIAENKTCDYQIVLPERSGDPIVDGWLMLAAKLTRTAFEKNGFTIPITHERAKAQDKPALYLGGTEFAKANGVAVETLEDWTCFHKVVGRDVIIAGRDKRDAVKKGDGNVVPLALLGTVKGVCDFLRERAGVRFLFMNFDHEMLPVDYPSKQLVKDAQPLVLDTRSIAFLPAQRITLPANLDVVKKPLMLANYDTSKENLFNIANNFFPQLGSLQGGEVRWQGVMPTAKYAQTHPEFFALLPDGKRACELKVGFDDHMMYCPTHPGVQDLMYQAVEQRIAEGHKIVHLSPMDAYRLCHCNCDGCVKLFGSKAANFDEIRARGDTGRLWQAYFRITERARASHPKIRFVILNYQDTPVSAQVIQRFPENVIVHVQFAGQHDFDKLTGVEFPAGISGFEETFTGFGQAGPYIAERTPAHMAEVVQSMARNRVKWSNRDGSMGYVRGLQAPAYYVYGRMMDDPSADWRVLQDEFCQAAFGEVAKPMADFFDLLHTQMAIYSDFFGVFMPAWDRKYSRSYYHDSKWHVMSIYTPEFCQHAEGLLRRATAATKDADILARLHFISLEFGYAARLSRVFYLQNAWTLNPSQANLHPLLDAIDEWHAGLEKMAGGRGRTPMKPLPDWPQMTPFNGHFYTHAALETEGYQQQWNKTCLNWDTRAIRAGALDEALECKVTTVEQEPALDSKAWESAPTAYFRVHDGMPYANISTRMKVLRDKTHLYVRVECLHPHKHPEDFYQHKPDESTFTQEYVEVAISPPNAGGKVFRIAANPVAGSRYDAVYKPDGRNLVEDKTWNGSWQANFTVDGKKDRFSLPDRTWTLWLKIPFADLGASPGKGEAWGFNAGRGRNGQQLLWHNAPYGAITRALGKLQF